MSTDKLGSIDITMSLETSDFKKSVNEVTKDSKELRKDFRVLDAELKNVERTEEGLAKASKQLSTVMDRQKAYVKSLENAQARLTAEGKQGTTQFNRLQDNLRSARIDLERTRSSMNRLNSEMDKLSEHDEGGLLDTLKDTNLGAGLIALVKSPVTAGLTAIGLGLKMANEEGQRVNETFKQTRIALALTGDDAQKLKNDMFEVFGSGQAKDIEESGESIKAVRGQMSGLSVDTQDASENVLSLSRGLGDDLGGTAQAVGQLMRTFGLTSEQAFDLMANGIDENLNKNDDLIDTINEYSGLVKQTGMTAGEFFGILNAGMKAGARNTDLVADAVKEIQIRMQDGTIEKELGSFSTKTQDLFKKWQQGKVTTHDVMMSIMSDVGNAKVSSAEYKKMIGATGTQFEDLGQKALQSMGQAGDETDKAKGKMNEHKKATQQNTKEVQNLKKEWSLFGSEVNRAGKEMGQALAVAGNSAMNWLNKLDIMLDKVFGMSDSSRPVGGRSYAQTPSKSYKGGYSSNPYSGVGQKPSYQVTQNIYTNGGTEKGVNQANKKISNKMGKGW